MVFSLQTLLGNPATVAPVPCVFIPERSHLDRRFSADSRRQHVGRGMDADVCTAWAPVVHVRRPFSAGAVQHGDSEGNAGRNRGKILSQVGGERGSREDAGSRLLVALALKFLG